MRSSVAAMSLYPPDAGHESSLRWIRTQESASPFNDPFQKSFSCVLPSSVTRFRIMDGQPEWCCSLTSSKEPQSA